MVQVWTGVYTVPLSHAAVSLICSVLKQRYKENRWDPKQLIGSGGMPSSHSATVTALAVAIGFQDGFNCSLFATATIFASVVGYQFYITTHVPSEEVLLLESWRKMIIYIVVAWMQFSVLGWTFLYINLFLNWEAKLLPSFQKKGKEFWVGHYSVACGHIVHTFMLTSFWLTPNLEVSRIYFLWLAR